MKMFHPNVFLFEKYSSHCCVFYLEKDMWHLLKCKLLIVQFQHACLYINEPTRVRLSVTHRVDSGCHQTYVKDSISGQSFGTTQIWVKAHIPWSARVGQLLRGRCWFWMRFSKMSHSYSVWMTAIHNDRGCMNKLDNKLTSSLNTQESAVTCHARTKCLQWSDLRSPSVDF